jgi:hypothetical protein
VPERRFLMGFGLCPNLRYAECMAALRGEQPIIVVGMTFFALTKNTYFLGNKKIGFRSPPE